MHETAAPNPTDLLASPLTLGDLLDATSLAEVLGSFYALFRLPVRILNERGGHFARTQMQAALNEYLGELPRVAKRLGEEHRTLRVGDLGEGGELFHRAFTGASYYVGAIGHEGRAIGRFIIGPFRSAEAGDPSEELLASDPDLDVARVRELLDALPRVREETVKAIARHLSVTLDALIFSGYRAKLSEYMHLSSVQENGRQLSEAGQTLRAQEQRREESQRLQGRLLGAVAAELTEPVRVISDQVARLDASSPREQGDAAGVLRQQARHLAELAERLLQLANTESRPALQKQEIEPAVLLDRARAALGPGCAERVELAIEGGLPRLWCDAARVGDALRLLCENALEARADGVVCVEARRVPGGGRGAADLDGFVLLGKPPELLELRVADRGPNVAERDLERVSDASHELGPERGSVRGGLRLAVVKRLVEAHEGSIRIEDNTPAGAVFVVVLPLFASGMGL